MKKLNKAPIIAAMASGLMIGANAQAESNPFGMSEMSQAYMQLAKVVPVEPSASDAGKVVPVEKAGEMKCGAGMKMDTPAAAPKKADGSCGEGKCGAMMQDGKMKPGMEQTCGAMMKGKEGACGEMKDKAAPAKAGGEMACGAKMNMGGGAMDKKMMDGACAAKMK